jgi:hypothetical protein
VCKELGLRHVGVYAGKGLARKRAGELPKKIIQPKTEKHACNVRSIYVMIYVAFIM